MRGSKGFDIRRLAMLAVHLCTMAAVLLIVCGCNDQLTRMEENQVKLQAMLAANARELATISSQVHTGQGKVAEGFQNLDGQAQAIAGTTLTIQDDQRQLRETVVAGNQNLDTKATALQTGQQTLQASVTDVQDVTGRTASDLTALARQHTALHETVQANQRELNDHMGVVAGNQQGIQAGIARLHQADEGLARDIASVAGKQDAQATALQDSRRQTVELLAALAAEHERLATDLLNVRGIMQGVATDVTGIAEKQTTLHATSVNQTAGIIAAIAAAQTTMQESLTGNHEFVAGRLTSLAESQQNLHAGISALDGRMDRMTVDAAGAASTLQQTLSANHENVTGQIAGLSARQQTLQSGVNTLNNKADQAAAHSATAVSSLQDAVRVNREVLTGQMAASLQNQQAIQTGVDALNGKADGMTTTLAAVSAEQAAAREMSQTNQQAVITAMAGLADEHQTLRTGVTQIDGKADRMGGELTAVAAEQKAMHETARDNHEGLVARLGNLSSSQAELHGSLSTLNDKADATTAELAAAAQRHSAIQQSLAGVKETLGSHAMAVAENQQSLKAGVADLNNTTKQMSTDLTAATTAQDNFRQKQQNHNEVVDSRTAALADSQQAIRNQLDTLTATTSQTALSVLTMNNGQATFQQAMQTGMNGLHERADHTAADVQDMAQRQVAFQESIKANNDTVTAQTAAVVEGHQTLKADLSKTSGIIDRAYADLTAVALAQDVLQTTLANHSEKITSHVARIENNQKTAADNLDVLTATTGQTAIDVLALADGQTDLQRSIKTGNDTLVAKTITLAENQKALGNHLDVLTATTGQTAMDILTLGSDQSKLTQKIDTGLAGLNERADRLAADQQKAQAGVDTLTATTTQTALDVIAVAGQQNTLQKSLQNHGVAVDNRMATLAGNQRQLQTGVDTLTATTGQTALDVIAAANRQDSLQKTVQNYGAAAGAQMAKLAENQQRTQAGVDTLTATTSQTALDVLDVAGRQEILQSNLQTHSDTVTGHVMKLAGNQEKVQGSVDVLTATAGQTALDVIAVAERQNALQMAIQSQSDTTANQMAALAGNQQKTQSSVDALTATAGQTAQDVLAVAERQDRLSKAIQSHDDAVAGQVAKVAENQQKLQGGVDALAATTGQTALDIIEAAGRQEAIQAAIRNHSESADARLARLADGQGQMHKGLDAVSTTASRTTQEIAAITEAQAKSEQAAQAGRTEVAGKLTQIAQDQQSWQQRFDTAQTRMQTMAEVIAALEQQLGDLQGTLQTGLTNTSALANANGQQRQQFEAKIAQDVQTMIEAIAYLRQTQTQLQEQVSQVQKSTQTQTETLKATIEQIKQPPAEVKVSDAIKQPEPIVVQTGE